MTCLCYQGNDWLRIFSRLARRDTDGILTAVATAEVSRNSLVLLAGGECGWSVELPFTGFHSAQTPPRARYMLGTRLPGCFTRDRPQEALARRFHRNQPKLRDMIDPARDPAVGPAWLRRVRAARPRNSPTATVRRRRGTRTHRRPGRPVPHDCFPGRVAGPAVPVLSRNATCADSVSVCT